MMTRQENQIQEPFQQQPQQQQQPRMTMVTKADLEMSLRKCELELQQGLLDYRKYALEERIRPMTDYQFVEKYIRQAVREIAFKYNMMPGLVDRTKEKCIVYMCILKIMRNILCYPDLKVRASIIKRLEFSYPLDLFEDEDVHWVDFNNYTEGEFDMEFHKQILNELDQIEKE